MPNANRPLRALDLIMAQPWAITEDGLAQLLAIAQRVNEAPEAVAAKLGRPLDNARAVTVRDQTAIIPVSGPIFRHANLFTEISGATSVEILAQDIQTALEDRAIQRIVLEVDSPGGQATGIAELAALIRASSKPITAYVDGMAASAAYWLAAAAQELVVSSTALLGSIGVVASFRAEKDGPLKVISSQSPLKQATPDTETGRAEVQRVVDELAAVFIADVAAFRDTTTESVQADFGRGGVLVGAAAVAAGMADRVGTFEQLFQTAGTSGSSKGKPMTYQADLNAALGLPADASAEEALVTISTAQEASVKDARMEGRQDGATAERARIQAVREQLIPGHEAMIERLAFDGKTTGEQAAVQVLAAERESRQAYAAGVAQHTAPPVPAVPGAGDPEPVEAKDFEGKISELVAEGKTRGQAIRAVASAHPDLHRAYLARINHQAA